MKALKALLSNQTPTEKWLIGNIPNHYKRINIDYEEQRRLARIGFTKILAYYGDKLFYTQSIIAGACLCGDYDTVAIISPSQYGKSWLMGRIVPLKAFEDHTQCFIAGGDADKTNIIQSNVFRALQTVAPEVKRELNTESKDKLDKLATSVSKTKISYSSGGSIEPISLGEAYGDISRNKSVGRGGDFFVDEAALISDDTFAELGRRDFASIDGSRGLMVLISNPHKQGYFMDRMTEEEPSKRTLIIWMDILTSVEEGRTTAERVLDSDFARNRSTRKRYLMCELDSDDEAMFNKPKIYRDDNDLPEPRQHFLGIDSAYKGKDNLMVCHSSVDENGMVYVEEIEPLKTDGWTQGKTSKDLIGKVYRIARSIDCAYACIDIGWGVWLTEGLAGKIAEEGINFASSPTKSRVKSKQYAASNAANRRAEMHLDLQGLIDDEQIVFSEQAWNKVKDIFPFVTSERKSNGKIAIVPKSKIKQSLGRSPDELDAVLLSIHAIIRFMEGVPIWFGKHDE